MLAALLWLAFGVAIAVDVIYIRQTRAAFEGMYEGLGSALPAVSRFFLSPMSHLMAFAVVPLLALGAGITWRLKAKAGIAALVAAIVLATGWGIAYRWAMKLPVEAIEHAFDSAQ